MKKINEVSKISGVTRRTLQYYDNEGLVSVNRSSLNYRMYDQESLISIWEILIYREIGFELEEIKKMNQIHQKEVEQVLEQKLKQLENEKEELESKIKFLKKVMEEGIPPVQFDDQQNHITYVESIRRFRNSLKAQKEETQ